MLESHSSDQESNSGAFEYDGSLADTELPAIRLLILWPKSEGSDHICCSLSEHFLNNCPQYETLSYTWGTQPDRTNITCNGRPLNITSSLSQILSHLRGTEERLLWIDQICINQNDDREKSQQVGMMRDIYRRSSQTVAWLGNPTQATKKVFATLQRLATAGAATLLNDENHAWSNLLESELESYAFLVTIARDPQTYWGVATPDREEIDAVYTLLGSSWFTRMWIIQEATVSERLIVQSGKHSLPLTSFIFANYILQTMTMENRDNKILIAKGGVNMLQTLAFCRQLYRAKDVAELNIVQLICRCYQFQATDDRDRLFALYGLTSTSLLDLGLTTDYTMDARRMLCLSYLSLMRSDKSLRLLELCETTRESDLPSWIPLQRGPRDPKLYPLSTLPTSQNFGQDRMMMRMYVDAAAEYSKTIGMDYDSDAADTILEELWLEHKLKEEPQPLIDHTRNIELLDDGALCVQGQFLDRVTQVSPVAVILGNVVYGNEKVVFNMFNRFEDYGDELTFKAVTGMAGVTAKFAQLQVGEAKAWVSALTSIDVMATSKDETAYYQSKDAVLSGYRNTVCAGTLASEPGKDVNRYNWTESQTIEAFNRWRAMFKSSVQIDKLKKKLGMNGSSGIASLFTASMRAHTDYDINSKVMLGTATDSLPGRRLAWTARGHLALVPARAAVGDYIFALKGGQMPFVLRSYQGDWKLLGPTYVDGMMKGEFDDDDATGPLRLI